MTVKRLFALDQLSTAAVFPKPALLVNRKFTSSFNKHDRAKINQAKQKKTKQALSIKSQ